MFLGLLNESEKNVFLELAYHVATSDGNFSSKQKEIISTYCFEMQIDNVKYDKEAFDLKNNLSQFSIGKSRKIALLEIMALIYSDNIVHKEEQKIIDAMLETFEFSQVIAGIYLEWTKTILATSEQGKLLIEL